MAKQKLYKFDPDWIDQMSPKQARLVRELIKEYHDKLELYEKKAALFPKVVAALETSWSIANDYYEGRKKPDLYQAYHVLSEAKRELEGK